MRIETWAASHDGPIDIEEAEDIEIVVKTNGKVLWINTSYGCLLRICRIKGTIDIKDERVS